MNTFIILCSFLTLQSCNQSKNNQKIEETTSIEYHEILTKNSEKRDTTNMSTINMSNPISEQKTNNIIQDTILKNIQKKITKASYDGFSKRNTKKLSEIEFFLENNKTENEQLKNYWIAYINYYKTMIYICSYKTEN